jgi:hypothetical protein
MSAPSEIDDLDTVCAIWILASNDENALITYRGLVHRLGLSQSYDIKALVASRPELFRPGATDVRIDIWKSKMRAARSIPGWISAISNEAERKAAIEAISSHDVFRSQFRAHADAAQSPIEVIKWGLEHLDRLRKAKTEAKDASAKRWQMWLVFWVSLLGVLSQFAIVFAKDKGWI